jgi:hypothetical protein
MTMLLLESGKKLLYLPDPCFSTAGYQRGGHLS